MGPAGANLPNLKTVNLWDKHRLPHGHGSVILSKREASFRRDRDYLHRRILAVSGRIFLATCVSSNIYGPSAGLFESPNFRQILPNRDGEGVGCCVL
jgi:hypothetical protein